MSDLVKVTIYTDGGCSGNPGPGGWGAVLISGKHRKELRGGALETTNNKMELTAVIKALTQLKKPSQVTLKVDSKYVMKGFTEWMPNWKNNGWQTASGPVKNKELWLALDEAAARHTIKWEWVKGHNGDKENERADALVQEGMGPYLGERDMEF